MSLERLTKRLDAKIACMAQELHAKANQAASKPSLAISPVMNAITLLRKRLQARTDSEHKQAFLRFVIVGIFAWEVFLFAGPRGGWTEVEVELSKGLFAFWTISIGILAGICIWPARNVIRRVVGMLSDVGGATFYVWLAGENGV